MDPELYRISMVLLTGSLTAAAAALVGSFLVLRRMALIGDAISHAILPGIVVGFLLSTSRHPLILLPAAAAAGLLTVWLIELIYRSRRLSEDASTAVVFPALFALGVLMIARIRYVDLDLDCVIFGRIEDVDRRPLVLFGTDLGPRAVWLLGIMLLLDLLLVVGLWKELKISTFDPAYAESLGFNPTRIHYLLMTAISLTAIAAFEAVGAILVVAFLVVPAATAILLTNRLWLMVTLAVLFGVASVVLGYVLASEPVLNSQGAAAMAVAGGLLFLVVWLLAPHHGLLAAIFRRRRLQLRFAEDLVLLHLERGQTPEEITQLLRHRLEWSERKARRVLSGLAHRGLLVWDNHAVRLTLEGEQAVAELRSRYSA